MRSAGSPRALLMFYTYRMNQLSTWLQSSQDPTAVANKVKGLILFASSAIIFSAALFFHVKLSANDIISLATELGAVAGAVWTIYGVVLHIITWLGSIKSDAPANLPIA